MRAWWTPDRLVAAVLCVATACAFGPHLLILSLKLARVQPPGALVFLCVLHGPHAGHTPTIKTVALTPANRR
jgi:hypothetical protein